MAIEASSSTENLSFEQLPTELRYLIFGELPPAYALVIRLVSHSFRQTLRKSGLRKLHFLDPSDQRGWRKTQMLIERGWHRPQIKSLACGRCFNIKDISKFHDCQQSKVPHDHGLNARRLCRRCCTAVFEHVDHGITNPKTWSADGLVQMRCGYCRQDKGVNAFGPLGNKTIPHCNKCWKCYADERIEYYARRFRSMKKDPTETAPDVEADFDRDAYSASRGAVEQPKDGTPLKEAFYQFLFRGTNKTVASFGKGLKDRQPSSE